MAVDKIIFQLKQLMAGISPTPPLQQPEPSVIQLTDMRPGSGYERIVFQAYTSDVDVTYYTRVLNFLGTVWVGRADSWALIGDQLLVRRPEGEFLLNQEEGVEPVTIPGEGLRFSGIRGSIAFYNHPGPRCVYLTEPGTFPTFTEDKPVPSRLVFMLENCFEVYGVQGFEQGMLLFGDQLVSYWHLLETAVTPSRQTVLSSAGTLSAESWAVGTQQAFWIGADRNLWTTDGKKVQKLGYSWLWPTATRARLTWIEATQDLFIYLDDGTTEELGTGQSFLYHSGMTELSEMVTSVAYISGVLYGLTADGRVITISLPMVAEGALFNWDTFVPGAAVPDREPDLVTSWADFYSALQKTLSGLEVAATPQWPSWAVISANLGGPDQWVQFTRNHPIGETPVAGNIFQLRFWFPTAEEAGAYKISAIRAHVQGEDLRGIYGAASSQQSA